MISRNGSHHSNGAFDRRPTRLARTHDEACVRAAGDKYGQLIKKLDADARRRNVEDKMPIAEVVFAANEELGNPKNGNFGEFVDDYCPFSRRTANHYVQVYRVFKEYRAIV